MAVKAMLSAISLPIRASRWVVEPASTSNKDKLIAAFVIIV